MAYENLCMYCFEDNGGNDVCPQSFLGNDFINVSGTKRLACIENKTPSAVVFVYCVFICTHRRAHPLLVENVKRCFVLLGECRCVAAAYFQVTAGVYFKIVRYIHCRCLPFRIHYIIL